MSEKKKEKTPEASSGKMSKTDLLAALQQDFATSVNRVYITSLGREVGFREITAKEQKTLSRVMIDNEKRKDIVFDAQCALINAACLEPDVFDVYKCSEFDRLKLLIALYQANMFKNEVKFICPKCGMENAYKLDFSRAFHKLDNVDLSPEDFAYENSKLKFNFRLCYPSVKLVGEFHKSNVVKYRMASPQQVSSLDRMSNIEYVDLFIEDVEIENKATGTKKTIHMRDYGVADVEDILATFPQDVVYSDSGVIQHVAKRYVQRVNDAFDKHRCLQCGEEYENDVGSADAFL